MLNAIKSIPEGNNYKLEWYPISELNKRTGLVANTYASSISDYQNVRTTSCSGIWINTSSLTDAFLVLKTQATTAIYQQNGYGYSSGILPDMISTGANRVGLNSWTDTNEHMTYTPNSSSYPVVFAGGNAGTVNIYFCLVPKSMEFILTKTNLT